MLDIFNNNAFGLTSLTDAVNDIKYVPSRIRDMGLFQTSRVNTTSVSIERVGNFLQLVSPSPRGGPGETRDKPKRSIDSLTVPHFQRDWAVMADEVQDVREMGSETNLRSVQSVVAERLAEHTVDLDMTEEHARLGAVTGIVTYADSTTLNLYTKFGVTQAAEVAFDLGNKDDGELRKACTDIIRATKKHLGSVGFMSVHAFCGDAFFDDLLKNAEVRETYQGWSESKILRESYVGKNRSENPMFEFGGIVFENYGEIDGEGVGVNTDKCQFFPVGVQGLFRTYYAPADYRQTVNTLGRRLYAKQWRTPNDKGIEGELQMNALQLCTRPKVLMRARRGT